MSFDTVSTISASTTGGTTVAPSAILNRARDLLALPAAVRDPVMPDGFAPLPGFAAALISAPAGAIGPLPGFAPPAVPAPAGVNANPQEAAYRAVAGVLALPVLPLAQAPVWGVPTVPADLPGGEVAAPPVDYPVQDLPAVLAGCGLTLTAADLPGFGLGERPDLVAILVDAFSAAPLAPFSEALPDYDEPPGIEAVTALPAEYGADADLRARLAADLAAVEPLDGAAQAALLAVATEDLDAEERAAEQTVFATAAARGFSLPCPLVGDGLLALADKGRKAREKANRAVRDEAIKRAQARLTAAAEGALALDRAHVAQQVAYAARLIKVARFNVKLAAGVLDTATRLFNAKVGMLATLVRSYRDYAAAVKDQNQAMSAQAIGMGAQVETYQAGVLAFGAQSDTSRALARLERLRVEVAALPAAEFEARLIGIAAQVATVRRNLEGYGAAVQAFSRATEADGERWDTYTAAVAAAESVVAVDTANARELAGYYQAEAARAQTHAGYTGQVSQVLGAALGEYSAYATAQRGYMAALTARVQGESQAVDAYARALGTVTNYAASWNRAEAERAGAANSLSLAQADQVTRQQALDAQATAAQGRIEAGRLAARAQAAAGLAQAYHGVTGAALRLGATVSMDQSTHDNGSQSWGVEAGRTFSATRRHTKAGDGGT